MADFAEQDPQGAVEHPQLGLQTSLGVEVTTYQYNNLDQLTRVEMLRPYNNWTYTHVRTWTYNTNGQWTAQTEPETGTTTYQYLSSGLLWKKTDAKGQVTEHVYDSATKRLAMLKRGSEQCEWVGFAYDQAQNSYGRLREITWGTPTACMTGRMKERFTYNGAGRVTAKYFDVTQFVITGYDQYGNPQGYDSTATVFSGYSYEGGQVKQVGYPAGWQEAALSYEYVKDALGRPIRLNQVQPPQPPVMVFGDVEYGPGGEMTRFGTETRAYNGLGQLTRITKPGAMDLEYRYSATANDGRITSQKDFLSGEEVVYQYDALKRLIRAESVGPEWGQSFTYDGWGNMRAISVVKGSAPVMATTADPATNRLGAWGYDANGNATSLPGATTLNLTYDAANRLIHAADGSSVDEWYAYAADNKRVWKRIGTTGVPVVTFWGIDGTRMGEFAVETRTPQGGSLTLALVRASTPPLTFAGKRIMTEDRLGSVNGSYYPYGQPKSGQTGAGERFATYYKDATGLEYAQNRYYSTTWGRFTTPDPFRASGGPAEPGSWNRYGYVHDDPVSYFDPSGLLRSPLDPFLGGGTLKALAYADRWLFTQEMKRIAIAGLNGLSESCVKLFQETAVGSPTIGPVPSVMIALRTAAESTWFYDYDGPEALLAFREATGYPDITGATIRDAAKAGFELGAAAFTLSFTWNNSRTVVYLHHVVILPAFRSLSPGIKGLVLVHELLHVVLGSAEDIFKKFHITDTKYTKDEMTGLTQWLEDGCPVPDGSGEP